MLTALPLILAFAVEPEPGFEPIFDGRSLDGWVGQDMSFWSVEDGAITGTISPDHRPSMNQYLVWQGGLVEDFELKLDFRLTGSTTPDTNGGFQFRSRRLPDGDVAGYQVDNNFGQPWKVRLYDEFGRHDLAREGERAVFGPDGRRTAEPLPLAPGASNFRLDEWHEYHLTADGPNLSLRINGKLVAAATDGDADAFEPRGILAMQLHTGPPMKAQFRNLRLRHLRPPTRPGTREALLAEAALRWQLGERLDAHQPPLKAIGNVTPAERAKGPGSREVSRIAKLENAAFDARVDLNRPVAWNVPGEDLTVYARARVPDGASGMTFVSKGASDAGHFRLFERDGNLAFEVRTDSGTFTATSPASELAPAVWHDIVGRYDGNTVQLLRDGKVLAEQPATGRLSPNDQPLFIGTEAVNGEAGPLSSGELEEVAVWVRALDDDALSTVCDGSRIRRSR